MTNIYLDGEYFKRNPDWHSEDSEWKARKVIKMLTKNQLEPRSICEVGCGSGRVLKSLAESYTGDAELQGFDISPQAYKLCLDMNLPGVGFHLKDFLGTETQFFDLIILMDVFEHVEDYVGFLKRLKGRSSFKMFHIPLDLSVSSVLRSGTLIKVRKDVGHLHYFTKETALATLEGSGYEVVDYEFTCGSIDIPSSKWKTRIMRLPRKAGFALNKGLTARILGGFSLLVLAR